MIRGVAFDWGGVLIEDPAPGLVRVCAARLGIPSSALAPVLRDEAPDFQRGHRDEAAFWRRVCARLDCQTPSGGGLWREAFREVYRPRPQVFSLARELQVRGVTTALLSNTETAARDVFRAQGYGMFDVQVFSCDEGLIKPEEAIYLRTAERMGLAPEEVAFFDDKPAFVAAARTLGMAGFTFQDAHACRGILQGLGLPVAPEPA